MTVSIPSDSGAGLLSYSRGIHLASTIENRIGFQALRKQQSNQTKSNPVVLRP